MIKIEVWARLEELSEKADYLDGFFKVLLRVLKKENFPIFFKEFYIDGNVPLIKVKELYKEVEIIEKELKRVPYNKQYIIDEPDFKNVENLDKYLNLKAHNMADLFKTSQGENIFEVFKYNIDYAIRKKVSVFIKYYSL